MSVLKEKSEVNFKSAELLKLNTCYCAAVHSAYYSCLQMMKHLLFEKAGYNELTLKEEQKRRRQGSSHIVITRLVMKYMKSQSKSARNFNNEILLLKKMRVEADYTQIEVDLPQCEMAISKSILIHNILKPLI